VHYFHRVVFILTITDNTWHHALHNLARRPTTECFQKYVLIDFFYS